GLIGHLVVTPEQLYGVDIDPECPFAGEVDRFAHAVGFVEDGGGIARLIAEALPDDRAVGLLQRDNRRALATRRNEDAIGQNQRRFAEPPADVRAAELV